MGLRGLDWIGQLPADLERQKQILLGLLAVCEADDRIRWLVIGCSLARGVADGLSDLDVALGVQDEFGAAVPDVHRAVDGLGDLIESYRHRLPSVTAIHERIFAQFADRSQVDMMVFPASVPAGSVPDVVVLYDPGDVLAISGDRHAVTPEQIRQMAFRGWCALADLGKYLRRQSPWEALGRLHEARGQLWQLWAAAHSIPDPQYGLTSVLDFAPGQLPPEAEDTVADLDPARLLSAARHLAALLDQAGRYLPEDQQAILPTAMARYITNDLHHLDRELLRPS
jgi:hypothetical protein